MGYQTKFKKRNKKEQKEQKEGNKREQKRNKKRNKKRGRHGLVKRNTFSFKSPQSSVYQPCSSEHAQQHHQGHQQQT